MFVKNLRSVEAPQDTHGRWRDGESEGILTGNSYNVAVEELFDLFGKFGPIRYVQRHSFRKDDDTNQL